MFLVQLASLQLFHKLALAVLIVVATLTLISFFGQHVFLELATHFRLQYVLASTLCIIVFIVGRSWKLLPLALFCALLNLAYILPYYLSAGHNENDLAATHFRVMQVNVLYVNQNYATLIDTVRTANPDIIVLQELTDDWLKQTRVLDHDYPYRQTVPKTGGSGMAMLSRYPFDDVETLTLDSSSHIALRARVNVAGTPVSVLSLHPPTPVRTDKFKNRNEQFARAAAMLRTTSGPRFLIGDLNTTMWSPYFVALLRESGLRDARRGFGVIPSWPVPLPAFMQLPIDHCLVSDDIVVEGIRTGGRTGSDHRPLIIDMQIQQGELRARR